MELMIFNTGTGFIRTLKKFKFRSNKFITFCRLRNELLLFFMNNHPIEFTVRSYEGIKIPALWYETRKIYIGVKFRLNSYGFEVSGIRIMTPQGKGKLVNFQHYNGTGFICLNGEEDFIMQDAFNETRNLYPFKDRNSIITLKTIKTKEAYVWMAKFVERMETAVMAMITKVRTEGSIHSEPLHCPPMSRLYEATRLPKKLRVKDKWIVPARKMTVKKRGK